MDGWKLRGIGSVDQPGARPELQFAIDAVRNPVLRRKKPMLELLLMETTGETPGCGRTSGVDRA
jgi:hypothetical protein